MVCGWLVDDGHHMRQLGDGATYFGRILDFDDPVHLAESKADQNLLLVATEKGEVALVEANSQRRNELGRFQAIQGKTWNHPVVAHGRLFVRNGTEMACFRLNDNVGETNKQQ